MLVGVNLLREGLDLPEVSLVAILDADKEGFLRTETSLIQTIGRAARNVNAEVILYADTVTDSMQRAIDETNRRREHATGVQRGARHHAGDGADRRSRTGSRTRSRRTRWRRKPRPARRAAARTTSRVEYLQKLYEEMLEAAKGLDFERAQLLRDQIVKLENEMKKKYGDDAPPSVLGGKSVPVPLPVGRKKGKWKNRPRA